MTKPVHNLTMIINVAQTTSDTPAIIDKATRFDPLFWAC